MDALTLTVLEVLPDDPAIVPLMSSHLTFARGASPACSVHAMDADALVEANVRFFAVFERGTSVAMAALKRIGADEGELKSMHVAEAARGRGLARLVLARLIDAAREDGVRRVSLETGSQAAFAPARGFYAAEGFAECAPFGDYTSDPNSVFMTRLL